MRALITGGAGFIGTHLARALLDRGDEVVVLDALSEQVHGASATLPSSLLGRVEFIRGDVRHTAPVRRALRGVEVVFHLAAETGTAQSMYQIHRYADTTVGGTARLLECLVARPGAVRRVVLASSRAVYGEGSGRCPEHGVVRPAPRRDADLYSGVWDPRCPRCARCVTPVATGAVDATGAATTLRPASVYGTTKLTQEMLVLQVCGAAGIGAVVLRYQNVFGAGQSLRNPYTGILGLFASRIRAGRAPEVYEDGLMTRDFVHVSDAVAATVLAADHPEADGAVLDVGTGRAVTVLRAAQLLCVALDAETTPRVTGKYRLGDGRHQFAAAGAIARLGWEPRVSFADGIARYVDWFVAQESTGGRLLERTEDELRERSLLKVGRIR